MESGPGGWALIRSHGRDIIFIVYSFMKMENPIELIQAVVTEFIAARNISFNVKELMKIAEGKVSSQSRGVKHNV
jgi:hypothetical protein